MCLDNIIAINNLTLFSISDSNRVSSVKLWPLRFSFSIRKKIPSQFYQTRFVIATCVDWPAPIANSKRDRSAAQLAVSKFKFSNLMIDSDTGNDQFKSGLGRILQEESVRLTHHCEADTRSGIACSLRDCSEAQLEQGNGTRAASGCHQQPIKHGVRSQQISTVVLVIGD